MPNLQTQTPPPGLVRQLGFFSATALVISNMVGMAIFTTTGFMAAELGSATLVLACWTVGAVFALAGAISYSELGINFPSSGGEYVYLTRAYGPEWGFMTGWVSFFAGFSAPIAAAALGFSGYLGHLFPVLRADHASLRSEEHTSELQSLRHLVCRLLLEKQQSLRLRQRQRSYQGVCAARPSRRNARSHPHFPATCRNVNVLGNPR